ncbi:hypothetical protein Q9S78_02735 [Microbacterium sp. KSW-18]|uniref:DUF304 domain-containing protein n=1 Tax=Microbacterium aquilitoris TaxID=3067307 RepID=A0ABU3GFV2_9MICO|nr:hypothetical protein [Microbacterium sp. KSW-18]MDT3329578.1 hypothetical protein [Microbacterium sp. KSW-18]
MRDAVDDRRSWVFPVVALGAGLALFALAVAVVLAASDLDIWSILLAVVGGWALGAAFVGAVERLGAAGLIVHVVVASAAGAVLATVGSWGDLQGSPVLRAVVVAGGIALAPASAWIWIALLGRVLGRIRVGRRPSPPSTLDWRAAPAGGAAVEVRAVSMSMRGLAAGIVLAIIAAAVLVIAVLIGLSDVFPRLGPRSLVVLVALPFAGLAYLALWAVVQHRSATYTITFGASDVRIANAGREERFAYRDIDLLRWRERGEYARLEVRTATTHRTLLVGLTRTPALPPLSRRTVGLLEAEGLTAQVSRDRALTTYRR